MRIFSLTCGQVDDSFSISFVIATEIRFLIEGERVTCHSLFLGVQPLEEATHVMGRNSLTLLSLLLLVAQYSIRHDEFSSEQHLDTVLTVGG